MADRIVYFGKQKTPIYTLYDPSDFIRNFIIVLSCFIIVSFMYSVTFI